MSTNLYLSATRVIFTKSGREFLQKEEVGLRQTPTSVTRSIMDLPTFEEKLNAYCEWVKGVCHKEVDDSPGSFYWSEIYDDSPVPKDKDHYFDLDEGWGDDNYVAKVVLKGEPLFDEILKAQRERESPIPPFSFEDAEESLYGVGFRIIASADHDIVLRTKVWKMQEEEWELEFYGL